jgi:hypothetical protein
MIFRAVRSTKSHDSGPGCPAIRLDMCDDLEVPDLEVVAFEKTQEIWIPYRFTTADGRTYTTTYVKKTIAHYDNREWWTDVGINYVGAVSNCVLRSLHS